MKTLTLLRHAKSGWDDAVPRDFDRPLNPKGRRAAVSIGRHVRGLGLTFDHVIASPAVRVVETLDGFASGYGATPDPAWDRRLYLASASSLIEAIRETDAGVARLLLVAHNPGLEDLVLALTAPSDDALRLAAEEKYPTATIAEMTYDGEWADLGEGRLTLTRFIRPRDLDPTLGPDAL
jgi:phosphohistidine phosphatase